MCPGRRESSRLSSGFVFRSIDPEVMRFFLLAALAVLALPATAAQELDDPSGEAAELSDAEFQAVVDSLLAPLDWQTGTLDLGDGIATLTVPDGFRYLDTEDARYVLEELWGNPEDPSTMGLLFPEGTTPLDAESWAVNVSYEEDGYVDDSDAADIDYDDLLADMQAGTDEENAWRRENGYPTIDLVGWARPPYYDAETKRLHWAKELAFEGEEAGTLNYNIRVLGRRGVLVLNAIGGMEQSDAIAAEMPKVLAAADFSEGHRYADFNPDLDEVAAYGVAGLVAGKVFAKAGMFALLAKFWKVIAVGAVAVFSVFKKRLFGGSEEAAA